MSLRKASAEIDDSIVLNLEQDWNSSDLELFSEREKRFTKLGLKTLWTAVDRTIMFADSKVLRHHGKTLKEIFKQTPDQIYGDRNIQNHSGDSVQQKNNNQRYYNHQPNRYWQNTQQFPRRTADRNDFRRDSRPRTEPSFRHDPSGHRLPPPTRY